ncbi:MAG: trehalase / alfa-L-rhamnosidase / mannosyl oligosaccharide glucosidase [Lachnospiraceae bacterium]|nr:trehalase / alfa-L-rhamnosidase / mannosyl oligosaccharide glucosidase [Lachnospiraceae bacterium]
MDERDRIYTGKLKEYIVNNVASLLKEPRSFIRYPYIDPGSVYDGNVWDWDTYWSVYGLLGMMDAFSKEMQGKILEHAQGNVWNFLDHQLPDGYIPMMIEVAKWPEPYLNMRHKEGVLMNMHKPFLCGQICIISDYMGDYEWIRNHLEQLEKYFSCYDRNYYFENCGLYVWCDDIMIGMDNDPASFGRPKFSTANIYLNSFMVRELQCMAKILRQFGRAERADDYEKKSCNLVTAIQAECWDRCDQFFYSVDVDIKTRKYDWFHQGLGVFWKTLPIKIRTWSGFIPMWAGFCDQEQAASLVRHWKDETTFSSPFGIVTLAKDEKMFDLSVTSNPSNWLGPIWIVANYIVFRGCLDYGYTDDAEEMCVRTLRLLGMDLEKNGCLHEYYNPFDGSPIMNGGFINWNMLALSMLRELEAVSKTKA